MTCVHPPPDQHSKSEGFEGEGGGGRLLRGYTLKGGFKRGGGGGIVGGGWRKLNGGAQACGGNAKLSLPQPLRYPQTFGKMPLAPQGRLIRDFVTAFIL